MALNIYLRNLFRFCILILLQVLLLQRITLLWWMEPNTLPPFIPSIYPLFILLLPIETPVWGMLFLGFFTGITIDMFMNTAGIHAAASVFMAYLRTNVIVALLPKNLSEYAGQQPSIKTFGLMPFLVYSAFLILIHHIVVYSIETWSFFNFGRLLLQITASTFTSLLFIVIYLLLFTRQTASRYQL